MRIDVNNIAKNCNTPLTAPAYPVPTYKFVNREYLNIIYRTDEKTLHAAVPEPLEITEPLVKFEVMWMPDVSGLGAYTETRQVIPVSFNGEEGAIASGRELTALKLGALCLYWCERISFKQDHQNWYAIPNLWVKNEDLLGFIQNKQNQKEKNGFFGIQKAKIKYLKEVPYSYASQYLPT